MFKYRFVILFIMTPIICGIGFNGCSRKQEPEPGRYYSKEKGFSIKFPEDWETKTGRAEYEPVIQAASRWEDDVDRFREYISIEVDDLYGEVSLEDYYKDSVEEQIKTIPSFREIESGELRLRNVRARWIIFGIGSEEEANTALVYCLVKGRRGYLISCVAEASKFPDYRSRFEEIVRSFRFE